MTPPLNRPRPPAAPRCAQRGAALLAALLTVAIVAALSATAIWRHWGAVEQEQAERLRQQARWVLTGALGWARLILREDGRDNSVDHLSEPWAVPLKEARLDQFLQMDARTAPTHALVGSALLQGHILDAQAGLNLNNLLTSNGQISSSDLQAWQRLFRLLGLPESELQTAARRFQLSRTTSTSPTEQAEQRLPPQRWADWLALGLSPQTLQSLRPHASFLPERTPLNVNTASATALQASIPGLNAADAQQIALNRNLSHYASLTDLQSRHPVVKDKVQDSTHSVASRYFHVIGQLSLDGLQFTQVNLVQRDGSEVQTVRREGDCPAALSWSACTLSAP